MIHRPHPRPDIGNPASCPHRTFGRVGIQRAPVAPFRLYLLTCRDCGTTLTTQTLRARRARSVRTATPATSEDPSGTWHIVLPA